MPFKPGASGNPGGRPKEENEVKRLARDHTEKAIERLGFWLNSDNPKASVSAATALLDRGWGKPTQFVGGDSENPIEQVIRWASSHSEATPDPSVKS